MDADKHTQMQAKANTQSHTLELYVRMYVCACVRGRVRFQKCSL